MVTLEFYDPSGRLEARQPHAPRLDGLAGYWLQGYSPGVIGREIHLPEDFARLVARAERDLYGGEGGRDG